jgi:hypothetical protein
MKLLLHLAVAPLRSASIVVAIHAICTSEIRDL